MNTEHHQEQAIRNSTHLEEDGDGGNLFVVRLVPVGEMSSVGQIQGHDAVMRVQKRCVHLQHAVFGF